MSEFSVVQLKAKMNAKEPFQLVDIREFWEVNVVNIGGKHIPLAEILERSDELSTDIPCIIHCKTGKRSAKAVKALKMHFGFTNLYNLVGGIETWASEIDYSIEKY